VVKHCGAHVSYTSLKRCYEELLNRCNQLMDPETEAEAEEQMVVRTTCVKAFLLLLFGYTLFAGKINKTVNLVWLLALHDLDELGEWSWGGMRLDFLYDHLSLTSDSYVAVVGGYMTLLVVIYFFLIFLVNRKCIVVCMILVLI
jgi:hypothetical protein